MCSFQYVLLLVPTCWIFPCFLWSFHFSLCLAQRSLSCFGAIKKKAELANIHFANLHPMHFPLYLAVVLSLWTVLAYPTFYWGSLGTSNRWPDFSCSSFFHLAHEYHLSHPSTSSFLDLVHQLLKFCISELQMTACGITVPLLDVTKVNIYCLLISFFFFLITGCWWFTMITTPW